MKWPWWLQRVWTTDPRHDPTPLTYLLLVVFAVLFPVWAEASTGGNGSALISQAADSGVYVLLAIGLNVVVGFAGLLDLGYAAFFAIGAYTYGLLASSYLGGTPVGVAVHLPFWVLLIVGMFVAAAFGLVLGAPTLRLRGDYLAIVTLGFGEIVPRLFRNLSEWTGGVNGISALDAPQLPIWITGPWAGAPLGTIRPFVIIDALSFYVIMVGLLAICVVLVNNLQRSRLGRAWMAVREDEVAAEAMGVNTVAIKLLAFAIGAAFSGFAGTFYSAKLSLVSPENFGFVVSITVLVMIVLGGMGNIPGVIVGSILLYYFIFNVLADLPFTAESWANAIGLGFLIPPNGDWPGLGQEVQRLKFMTFGIILVLVMLLRPQGLLPSRIREQELVRGVHDEPVSEVIDAGETPS